MAIVLSTPVSISLLSVAIIATAGGNIISVAISATAGGNIISVAISATARWQYHFCGYYCHLFFGGNIIGPFIKLLVPL